MTTQAAARMETQPNPDAKRVSVTDAIEHARTVGHGNLDVPLSDEFIEQADVWRHCGPDETSPGITTHLTPRSGEENETEAQEAGGSASEAFDAMGTTAPWIHGTETFPVGRVTPLPGAAPTRRSASIPTLTHTGVVQPPCICPACHMDGKFVELIATPADPQNGRPFRYPGQLNVTNLLYRRKKLYCPECRGQYDD